MKRLQFRLLPECVRTHVISMSCLWRCDTHALESIHAAAPTDGRPHLTVSTHAGASDGKPIHKLSSVASRRLQSSRWNNYTAIAADEARYITRSATDRKLCRADTWPLPPRRPTIMRRRPARNSRAELCRGQIVRSVSYVARCAV